MPPAPPDGRTGARPDRVGYPTLRELADDIAALSREHPRLCRTTRIGRSRAGRPLTMLSVGSPRPAATAPPHRPAAAPENGPPRHVLVLAGPHANEPVGGATALHLARTVLVDPALRSGTTWHFVPCIDPDAAALNEGWTAGPVTLPAMHRHFYRPAFADQAEWLPSGAPLPETRALLRAVDALRPALVCSLHGVDVGGTFLQLTADIPGIAEALGKSAAVHDVPVAAAVGDACTWPSPGPGVYVMPDGDFRLLLPDGVAGSTWTHPARHGGMTAIVEAPMWAADRVGDTTPDPDGGSRGIAAAATLLRDRTEQVAELADEARRTLPAGLPTGPLLRAVAETVTIGRRVAEELHRDATASRTAGRGGPAGGPPPAVPAGGGPDTGRRDGPARAARPAAEVTATRAYLADARLTARRLPLRAAAMLGRLAPRHRRLAGTVEGWSHEYAAAARARWIPVPQQVSHQSRMVLEAAALLD